MRKRITSTGEIVSDVSRVEFEAYRQLAGEAADALAVGHVLHVSNTRETDLRELVRYCTDQIERIDAGLPPLEAMAYLKAIMRVLKPKVHAAVRDQ